MRRYTPAIFAAAILGLLVWGYWPRPLEVDMAQVSRGMLRVSVTEEGRTRIRERYVVAAPVAGLLRRIDLEAGDAVRVGSTLAVIDPVAAPALDARSREQAVARVSAADAALSAAESDAEFARGEAGRARALRETQMISIRELDLAESRWRAAQAAVSGARAELESARAALLHAGISAGERVVIPAPVEGVVLALRRKSEGPIVQGEPILDLGDLTDLEVEVDVLSGDAVRIGPGSAVLLHRWGGEGTIEGRVRTVEPAGFTKISALGVEEQRVLVIVDILDAPERRGRLGHGYRVEAEFVLWEEGGVLQVPASALFRSGDGWATFAVEAGVARERRVEPGHRTGLSAQILSGLSEGETVIVHPDRSLGDGRRVAPRGG